MLNFTTINKLLMNEERKKKSFRPPRCKSRTLRNALMLIDYPRVCSSVEQQKQSKNLRSNGQKDIFLINFKHKSFLRLARSTHVLIKFNSDGKKITNSMPPKAMITNSVLLELLDDVFIIERAVFAIDLRVNGKLLSTPTHKCS